MGIHGKVKAFLAATVFIGACFVAVPHAAASNPTVFDSPGWIFNQSNGAYEILATTGASWFVGGIYPAAAGPFESYAGSPYAIVAAAESPDNKGYWTVDSRGSLIAHWFALQNRHYGSTYGMKNTAPIVALASSPSGYGYFEIAADGGVFSFGDAVFRGSLAGQALAAPIVAATYTDDGYILIDAAGNAYPFSAAGQQPTIPGSTRSFAISISKSLAAPGGYWILDADGSVRAILGAENFGDAAPNPGAIAVDIRGAAVGSYRVLYSDGVVKSFGGLQDAIGGVLTQPSAHATFEFDNSTLTLTVHWIGPTLVLPGSGNTGWTTDFEVWDSNHYGKLIAAPPGAPGLPQTASVKLTSAHFDLRLYAAIVDVNGGGTQEAPTVIQPAACGYWMVGQKGAVTPFGCAPNLGDVPVGTHRVVDLEATPSGKGYWTVDEQGTVYQNGDGYNLGRLDPAKLKPGETAASIVSSGTGKGYWIVTSMGRVANFGDAPFLGDMTGTKLNAPVIDAAATASGYGYYMVAADGGVFTFGDAPFYGSTGDIRLNQPAKGIVLDGDGRGYWFVAADGGVFSYRADFHGSMGATPLNKPVVGMIKFGDGYLMVASDGGIFNFSSAPFYGSLGANPPTIPIVAVAAVGG